MSSKLDATRGDGYVPTLTITGYKKPGLKGKVGKMTVPYDPGKFEVSQEVSLKRAAPIGNDKGEVRAAGAGKTDLKVDLLFDDTTCTTMIDFTVKTIMAYDIMVTDSVENKLQKFYDLCYKAGADTEQGNFLSITSGGMPIIQDNPGGNFECLLKSVKVQTNLISVWTGQRLKVTVSCVFADASSQK